MLVATIIAAHATLAEAEAEAEAGTVQQWAGFLTMPRGIATNVHINLTVVAQDSSSSGRRNKGIATTEWVYSRDNSGQLCVPHTETGLVWTEKANGDASADPDGKGNNFYALRGKIEGDPPVFTGALVHGRQTYGTFNLTLNGPRLPSQCNALPPHPPAPLATTNSTAWPMPSNFSRQGKGQHT